MQSITDYILENKQDAIIWQAKRWMTAAADPFAKGTAVTKVAELLANIKDMMVLQAYVDFICKEHRLITVKQLNDALGKFIDRGEPEGLQLESDRRLPAWMDAKALYENGFCEVTDEKHVGYYSISETGGWLQSSNFTIKPIFHVAGEAEDSRHIFEVWNGVKRVLMDVPSRVFISKDVLHAHLVAKGAFIFFGSAPHLLRISASLLPHFPLCHEIKQLGWQREGFFAYADRIFLPGAVPKDKEEPQKLGELMEISGWGIFEVAEQHFLIPAASQVYTNQRLGDDPFKHVRVMSFRKSPVTFKQWAAQMEKVYGEKGLTGVAYALATAFRDLLFSVNHNFPHLYGHGERSSGKSQWAASICALFFNDRAAYNVNSGTDFAFFSYMQAFTNAPANLNEVDDKVLKQEWFQAIKGVFDGEGRMRGKMGSRTQIEVQQADAGLILIGQYLSTQDDNSLVSRSCIEAFAEKQYSEQEKAEFMKLTEWQKAGITGLLQDVLQHRPMIETRYYGEYNEIVTAWRRMTLGEFNQRIFQNWAHLSTIYLLFEKLLGLPMEWVKFDVYCYRKAVEYSRFIRSSDMLTNFWDTVAFLHDQQLIVADWDFKITVVKEVKLRDREGEKEAVRTFDAPRKVLLLRLNNVHKLYLQAKEQS